MKICNYRHQGVKRLSFNTFIDPDDKVAFAIEYALLGKEGPVLDGPAETVYGDPRQRFRRTVMDHCLRETYLRLDRFIHFILSHGVVDKAKHGVYYAFIVDKLREPVPERTCPTCAGYDRKRGFGRGIVIRYVLTAESLVLYRLGSDKKRTVFDLWLVFVSDFPRVPTDGKTADLFKF